MCVRPQAREKKKNAWANCWPVTTNQRPVQWSLGGAGQLIPLRDCKGTYYQRNVRIQDRSLITASSWWHTSLRGVTGDWRLSAGHGPFSRLTPHFSVHSLSLVLDPDHWPRSGGLCPVQDLGKWNRKVETSESSIPGTRPKTLRKACVSQELGACGRMTLQTFPGTAWAWAFPCSRAARCSLFSFLVSTQSGA